MSRKREDLIGKRFGRLTVIGYDHTNPHGDTCWLCECDCGNRTVVIRYNLTSGSTRSCGCISHESEDLSGMKFNMLTVVERVERLPNGKTLWRCICDCGNETIVEGYNLKSGGTKSCGCLQKEMSSKYKTTHGMSNTRLYRIWTDMKQRCINENRARYKRYGGRGITFESTWNDFEPFRDWALSNGYDDDLSIDRINNELGYYPDNCRWTDVITQENNRSSNRYFSYSGETHTIAEWSRVLNVRYTTLYQRILRGDLRDFEDYFDKL